MLRFGLNIFLLWLKFVLTFNIKSVEEDGEAVLCAIEDETELQTVYDLIMEQLYADEDTSDED